MGSTGLRSSMTTPAKLCDILGGSRVINKVRLLIFFFNLVKYVLLRFLLQIMVLQLLSVCVQFDVGPMKCFKESIQ